jgi:hypothetical protein
MSDKKKEQLGMNPSTASGRLVKDILWNLIVQTKQDNCCKCNEQMTRETFSIEHVKPWLDSDDPIGLYFDLNNISFSHLSCNVADARKSEAVCGTYSRYNKHNCRCNLCREAASEYQAKYYTKESRRDRYIRTGN